MSAKGIHSRVLIDTFNQPSIDTPSTLDWHSNDISVDKSVDSQLILDRCKWVGHHLDDYQLTVDQVPIKMLIEGINRGFWLTLNHGCL